MAREAGAAPPRPLRRLEQRTEGADETVEVGAVVVRGDRGAQEAPAVPLVDRELDRVAGEELLLDLRVRARREQHAHHLEEHRHGALRDRRDARQRQQALVQVRGVGRAPRAHRRPVALLLIPDRVGDAEQRGQVLRALPMGALGEPARLPTPAHDQRLERCWTSRRAYRKPAPFGAQSHLWQLPP